MISAEIFGVQNYLFVFCFTSTTDFPKYKSFNEYLFTMQYLRYFYTWVANDPIFAAEESECNAIVDEDEGGG